MKLKLFLSVIGWILCQTVTNGEVLRKATTLDRQLQQTDPAMLAREARLRGDPKRGAVVFHRSAAACVNCHASGEGASPLGPNLARLREGVDPSQLTDSYLIESLVTPSRAIRPGYETVKILTDDGSTVSGILVEQNERELVLRSASDLERPIRIDRSTIEAQSRESLSMMPDGLMSAMKDLSQFYDLAAYVLEVADGGMQRAAELKPTAEQLAIKEDWLNLDHAGILKKLKTKDFEAGQAIYHGYCVDCHGADGNRPTLPTARAFGTQKMKFGSDPFKMFMTLTKGNGLMGSMSHLTPYERYQVVHYIREGFMKEKNPEYAAVDQKYLDSLPKGTEDGTKVPSVDRDYGPALASNLERRVRSALTIRLKEHAIAYDLHTMNQADAWKGGFLDLDDTPHIRNRGEGTAKPKGSSIAALQGWEWGHDGTLDYPRSDLLPRGPMPRHWMDYHGYYLHGEQVILSYAVDAARF